MSCWRCLSLNLKYFVEVIRYLRTEELEYLKDREDMTQIEGHYENDSKDAESVPVIHKCDDGRKTCATSYQPKSGGFYNFTCSAVNILGHFVKHSPPLLLKVTGEDTFVYL